MGCLDDDGYLYLVDRKTDMILVGGANVYPAEVEAALDAHPAVRSSAVIGLPDDDLGSRVHAIVDAPRRRQRGGAARAPGRAPRRLQDPAELRVRDASRCATTPARCAARRCARRALARRDRTRRRPRRRHAPAQLGRARRPRHAARRACCARASASRRATHAALLIGNRVEARRAACSPRSTPASG